MANMQIEFYSNSLVRPVTFKLFLPNDPRADSAPAEEGPIKTLFVLHGYTGAAENWNLEGLAQQYRFAIVSPSGENAFYLDGISTGHKFQTFLGVELVDYLRRTFGLAKDAQETYITGLSMGGFGALHTALAYPETFGKVGAMSSALIVHGIAHMKPGEDNGIGNYEYYRECFGDLETVDERDANPEVLVKALKTAGKKLPDIFFCCGTEDFLLEPNRQFHRFLESEQIPHRYLEDKGGHDNDFWSKYKVEIVNWMFG